jgi:hypothetical protein
MVHIPTPEHRAAYAEALASLPPLPPQQHHAAGDTGERVALKAPRKGFHFALGRADGRISYHRDFATAERLWRFGGTVYQWDATAARWRIWTSAGLF